MKHKFKVWDKERKEMRGAQCDGYTEDEIAQELQDYVLDSTGSLKKFVGVTTHKYIDIDNHNKEMEEVAPIYNGVRNHIPIFYTGLKDKNGKEIYEGDILHESGYPNRGMWCSIWDEAEAYWAACIHAPRCGGHGRNERLGGFHHLLTVIGNKYENPELLEGEG